MHDPEVLVLGCSPRKDGNSDRAALEVARILEQQGTPAEPLFLRDKKILPCMGCRKCELSKNNRCVLAAKDDVQDILTGIQEADSVYFCSPIYYYHLPAVFKALIDRGQSFYEAWTQKGEPSGASKKACCILIAGRRKGELLFQGSIITLKYFLHPLGFNLSGLCLRGLDLKDDLDADPSSLQKIRTFVLQDPS